MYEDINFNNVLVSGIIKVITNTNGQYIKFGITTNKYTLNGVKDVYVSLNISKELYYIYQDIFTKGNKVFIKGYLNYYIDKDNKTHTFITVTDISDNPNEITKGRSSPHIRYDADGVIVWRGKRCESIPPTKEEIKEMEDLLSKFK